MTREEAVMRLREDMMEYLHYSEHLMTLREVTNWLHNHRCDADPVEVLMEIIGG